MYLVTTPFGSPWEPQVQSNCSPQSLVLAHLCVSVGVLGGVRPRLPSRLLGIYWYLLWYLLQNPWNAGGGAARPCGTRAGTRLTPLRGAFQRRCAAFQSSCYSTVQLESLECCSRIVRSADHERTARAHLPSRDHPGPTRPQWTSSGP